MSTFTDIRDNLVQLGLPLLGAALPLPGGAAIGEALARAIGSPSAKAGDILGQLTQNPDALEKAKEFQAKHEEAVLRITTSAEIRAIEATNKTMQAEAASDHWPTYSWRPFIGFCAGFVLLFNYGISPALKLPPAPIDAQAWLFLTAVLGIASYFRGKAQADPNIPTDNRG